MLTEDISHDLLSERRQRLRSSKRVFGLDFVEVCPHQNRNAGFQRILLHLLGQSRPNWLNSDQLILLDRRNSQRIPVELIDDDNHSSSELSLELEVQSDLSDDVEYSLTIDDPQTQSPRLDPFFACVTFRFHPSSPAKSDCRRPAPPSAPQSIPAEINYLAKDYATFRQLILDRLAVTMPDWQERCPADIGIMMVEILAYSADHLSYYQDVVATEAYLGTARLRQSLRRHARLVDYHVHEGCNARTWMHLEVSQQILHSKSRNLFFVSLPQERVAAPPSGLTKVTLAERMQIHHGWEVFEPVSSETMTFWKSHNQCRIHDWSGAMPCLPRGATSAYLANPEGTHTAGHKKSQTEPTPNAPSSSKPSSPQGLQFRCGDFVLLEEVIDPWTGTEDDADPSHRHVVRLTGVSYEYQDDLYDDNDPHCSLPLVKISWDEADALPFTLWIRKPPNAGWDDGNNLPLSVARGNILLVDHGRTMQDQIEISRCWEMPDDRRNLNYPRPGITGELPHSQLTFSDRLPLFGAPAVAQLVQDPRQAVPQVVLYDQTDHSLQIVNRFSILELRDPHQIAQRLLAQFDQYEADTAISSALPKAKRFVKHARTSCGCQDPSTADVSFIEFPKFLDLIRDDLHELWLPEYDLIDCGPDDARFVVEMSDERQARLRFGRRGFGRTPGLQENLASAELDAVYRVGNGTAGNVAAESIRMFGSYGEPVSGIEKVRNPLPATGGIDPELTEEIRLFAPHALRTDLQRAITPHDYEQLAMQEFGHQLQRTKVTFHWTGHEFKVLVAVDPRGRENPTPDLLNQIQQYLHRFRRIGHSVQVRPAVRVIPVLRLALCLNAHVIREQIRDELNLLFSHQLLADGTLAFFHPDQQTFGEGIFVSRIVAEATRILGNRIVHLEVTELHRSDTGPADEIENGVLPLWPQEIVRFDNDRNHPEFGTLQLDIRGGR